MFIIAIVIIWWSFFTKVSYQGAGGKAEVARRLFHMGGQYA